MTKYQQYYLDMIKQNHQLFEQFRKIHDNYVKNPTLVQDEFNQIGSKVQDVIRLYENRLCSHTQNSGYGKFSTNLSEKFQAQVKAAFPKINSVGLKKL